MADVVVPATLVEAARAAAERLRELTEDCSCDCVECATELYAIERALAALDEREMS